MRFAPLRNALIWSLVLAVLPMSTHADPGATLNGIGEWALQHVDRVMAVVRVDDIDTEDDESRAIAKATRQAKRAASFVERSTIATGEATYVRFFWWEPVKSPADALHTLREFGLGEESFERLNPGVDIDEIREGDRILVWRWTPGQPAESRGSANRGWLKNGMPMPDGPWWHVRRYSHAYGTQYAISHMVRGFTHVAETLPGARPVLVADVSSIGGGRLPPHRSHRTGRDADVSYYCFSGPCRTSFWDARRSPRFDVARQWELFRFWLERDVVTYIFVDRHIQRSLYEHALAIGEDPEWVDEVFEYPQHGGRGIIRDARGHDDHFHVRFRCAESEPSCRAR